MKLLDIFKRKKNAELECLRDTHSPNMPKWRITHIQNLSATTASVQLTSLKK